MSERKSKYEFRQPVEALYQDGCWLPAVVTAVGRDEAHVRWECGTGSWLPLASIRPDPDFVLVSTHTAPPEPPQPLGTLDACRKHVIADNAALEALAVQLEQDGHDAKAALARSLMRRWEGV